MQTTAGLGVVCRHKDDCKIHSLVAYLQTERLQRQGCGGAAPVAVERILQMSEALSCTAS